MRGPTLRCTRGCYGGCAFRFLLGFLLGAGLLDGGGDFGFHGQLTVFGGLVDRGGRDVRAEGLEDCAEFVGVVPEDVGLTGRSACRGRGRRGRGRVRPGLGVDPGCVGEPFGFFVRGVELAEVELGEREPGFDSRIVSIDFAVQWQRLSEAVAASCHSWNGRRRRGRL